MTGRVHAVMGRPKADPAQTLIIQTFADYDEAIEHALGCNMASWDDVFVRTITPKDDPSWRAPFPWRVQVQASPRNASRWTYIIDANGVRVCMIYGNKARRDTIVRAIERLSELSELSERGTAGAACERS